MLCSEVFHRNSREVKISLLLKTLNLICLLSSAPGFSHSVNIPLSGNTLICPLAPKQKH